MLIALRRSLAEAGPMTLDQIAGRFDVDRAAAAAALDLLLRRGDVAAEPLDPACGGCSGRCSSACGATRAMLYRATARPRGA